MFRNRKTPLYLLGALCIALASTLVETVPARSAILTDGSLCGTVNGDNFLTIGCTNDGSLVIDDGSSLVTDRSEFETIGSIIGFEGQTGSVTVEDAGSSWGIGRSDTNKFVGLFAGFGGTGNLTVASDASAAMTGGNGSTVVAFLGFNSSGLVGNGSLLIENGGTFSMITDENSTSSGINVATDLNSTASIRVTGSESSIELSFLGDASGMTVGHRGDGTVIVESGAHFGITLGSDTRGGGIAIGGNGSDNTSGPLGEFAEGNFIVKDPGSTLEIIGSNSNTDGLAIGGQGIGSFSVMQGGNVDVPRAFVATEAAAEGFLDVIGDGSVFDAQALLTIGFDVLLPVGENDFTFQDEGARGVVTVANDGLLRANEIRVASNGFLCGDGTVQGAVINEGGTVCPGLSPGTLTVDGDFIMSDGLVEIEVAGLSTGLFDVLDITGTADITGGTFRFNFLDGFLPQTGDTFDFLLADTLANFENVLFEFTGLAPGFLFDVDPVLGTGGSLTFTAQSDASPVPEPAGILVLGMGVAGLWWSRRRLG